MTEAADRPASAREAFDRTAHDYDRTRRQLVPCFDDFYGTALDLLPFALDAAPRILDLGAGTGLLSALIRDRYPHADLTLADIAPNMLEQAGARFGDDPKVTYEVVDLTAVTIEREYDAVVSALAIHHLGDPEKADLFRRVYAALVPGGVFINAEQVLGETPGIDRRFWDTWEREARVLGATSEDIAVARKRMEADRCATLEAQLGWLRDAGFRDVDCWYKWQALAVYAGTKPDRP